MSDVTSFPVYHQDLVLGDMVLLESGQRVPADVRIASTDGLKVRRPHLDST